jgi:protein-L-isoaspartate(D-aspartate) O-methyltransferase
MFFRKRDGLNPREQMIRDQLEGRGIHDPRVLDAFRKVPREPFVPDGMRPHAYDDRPLPIGEGQTISQPYITALMTQALELRSTHKVLEIGTGSGFQTALLALLSKEVLTIERFPHLSERAAETLKKLGHKNVRFQIGDGSLGLDSEAPFDRIILTAAPPVIPTPFLEQLSPSGIMVLPVGQRESQMLVRVWKSAKGVSMEDLCSCLFVPLVGMGGFKEEESR